MRRSRNIAARAKHGGQPPALEFVWRAACPFPTCADIAAMRAKAAEIGDWAPVLAAARTLRSAPMLHRALLAGAAPEAPPELEQQVRRITLANAGRNMVLRQRMLELIDVFEASGVSALPYKGIVLAAQAYEGIEDRQMEDLDFLVPPADLSNAIEVAAALGYQPRLRLRPAELRAQLRRGWGFAATHSESGVAIELDTAIGPDYFGVPLDFDSLLRHAVEIRESGRRVRTVAAPELLVLLCAHGAKHMWARPQWMGDLVGLIRRTPELDWDAVLALATVSRTRRILHTGLLLASDCAALTLPDTVVRGFSTDRPAHGLARQARTATAVYRDANRPASRILRYHLASRERLRDRVRYVGIALFKPSHGDWKWLPLPPPLFALYYVLRPLRLLLKGLSRFHLKPARRVEKPPHRC